MNIRASDGVFQRYSSVKKEDDTFTIENVRPGSYVLQVFLGMSGLYVKSIRFGDADVSSGALTITPGSAGDLNIALAADGGQVQGTIQKSSGTLAATGIISLLPTGIFQDEVIL